MPPTPGPRGATEVPAAGRSRLLLPALLLAALPAWWVASRGIAMALAIRDPQAALRWDPDNAEALVRHNESERDTAAKRTRARVVLAQRPRDGRAYRQLAEVAQASGDIRAARRLYGLAAHYSPRDRWTQAWLADDALRLRQTVAALSHIDQLLRMDALLPRHLFAVIAKLAQEPMFRAALVQTLRTASWREDFLAWWLASPEPSVPTLASLRDAGVPVSAPTRAALVMRALREGRATEAWLAWADGLAPVRASRLELVVNGGFEHSPSGAFDWQLGARSAADVQRAPRPDASGLALRIEFDGERIEFHDVAQRLLLPPGAYRFLAQVRPEELRSEGGLTWTVRCGSAAGEVLGRGDVLEGTAPWRRQAFDFEVPDRCALQWLSLELPARTAAESRIGGVLWVDDVRIRAAAAAGGMGDERPQSPSTDDVAATPASRPTQSLAMVWSLEGTALIHRGNLRMQAGPHALVRLHDRIIPAPGTRLHLRWAQGCDTMVTVPLQVEGPPCAGTTTAAPAVPERSQVLAPDPVQTALHASWLSEPSRDDPVGP